MLTQAELAEIRDILKRERESLQRGVDNFDEIGALEPTRRIWQERIEQYARLEHRIEEELT